MSTMSRPRTQFARALAVVLTVKFMALFAIWAVWFSEPESRHLDRERIGRVIYSAPSSSTDGGDAHARP